MSWFVKKTEERKRKELGLRLLRHVEEGTDMGVVEDLLSRGADTGVRNGRGRTILDIAAGRGDIQIVRALARARARLDDRMPGGVTALMTAAARGDVGIANALIASGADVNARDDEGRAPLHYAVAAESRSCAGQLAKAGARLDGGRAADAALFSETASRPDKAWAAHLLIDAGLSPAAGGNWDAALLHAAEDGSADAVESLVNAGARVNARDARSRTPLILAARRGRSGAVSVLLAHGADIDAADDGGSTPLTEAVEKQNDTVARLLLVAGAAPDGRGGNVLSAPLFLAAATGQADVMKCLLDAGARADGQAGVAALLRAATCGSARMADMLLSAGVHPDAANDFGATALHLAAQHGSADVARLLVAAGAGVDRRDGNGNTPLIGAVLRRDAAVCGVLLDAGADVGARSRIGTTVLDMARGYPAIADMVEERRRAREAVPAWRNLTADEAARTTLREDLGCRLTDIFNFRTRERFVVTEDLRTGHRSASTPVSFDAVGLPALEEAFAAYARGGGAVEESLIFGARVSRKTRIPVLPRISPTGRGGAAG